MQCVSGCPCDAIPHIRDGKTVKVQIEDKVYEWGDVQMGRCALSFHGGDPRVSPFLHQSMPGWEFDVSRQELSEDRGYKLCWPFSTGTWRRTEEDPSGYLVEGHAQIQRWGVGGSYAVGGSRGCMRSCFDRLEKTCRIEQTFRNGAFIKRPRWTLPHRVPVPPEGQESGS